jgi:hypothetical protein
LRAPQPLGGVRAAFDPPPGRTANATSTDIVADVARQFVFNAEWLSQPNVGKDI